MVSSKCHPSWTSVNSRVQQCAPEYSMLNLIFHLKFRDNYTLPDDPDKIRKPYLEMETSSNGFKPDAVQLSDTPVHFMGINNIKNTNKVNFSLLSNKNKYINKSMLTFSVDWCYQD